MLNAWLPLVVLAASPAPVVDHKITATLDPAAGTLAVTDVVTLPAGWEGRSFGLYKGLVPAGLELAGTEAPEVASSLDHAALTPLWRAWAAPAGERTFTVQYKGRLVMPPEQEPEEYARSFQRTAGTIQEEGVYLSAASGWIPRFSDELMTFTLEVKGLPEGWSALSEGTETQTGWRSEVPLDDVHLIAGPFWRREQKVGKDGRVNAVALLRSEDPALAGRYLDATGRYLEMYEALIGPYPFDKFAVVENFWETGYGMPSFTLLGPRVIRFPFILHSSYPHELLHNWWGNSVYLDDGGNWCEGLTAYLADHLVAEQRGQGAAHRRRILSRYRDFVTPKNDFALKDFRGRSSPSSEAVGYGKWAMVAHMLRVELGDEKFKGALRRFYRENRFQRAGFAELQAAFEAEAGHGLDAFFRAWIDRTGAPLLRWWGVKVERDPGGQHALEVILEQAPPALGGADPFPMTVPVRVALSDGRAEWMRVSFAAGQRFASARAKTPARPVQLDIDPRFDVFRRLDTFETPPTLSVALGEPRGLMVLPTFSSKKELAAWRAFAKKVCKPGACEVLMDSEVGTLPRDRAVWVLGYGNALRAAAIVGAGRYGARFDDSSFTLDDDAKDGPSNGDRATTLAFRHPRNPASAIVFVGSHKTEAIAGLARKLPHYGKYSYLQFSGDAPDNVLKGTWPSRASPMRVPLAGPAVEVRVRPSPPLAELPPPFDGARMLAFARGLADPRWAGRGLRTAGLPQALAETEKRLREVGLSVERQCFAAKDAKGPVETCNLVARLPGRSAKLAPVVLGAHIDHLGAINGRVHPGADDNASGVAVLVEVARALKSEGPFLRGVELVVFTAEESGLQGSRHYVSKAPKPFAMVNLDVVGRAGGRPFVVFGHESATEWVHVFRGIGFVSGVQTKMGAEGLAASDHQAFLEAKVPAVHLFSGPTPDYHKATDTADKLEPTSLVQAATLAKESVVYLAGRAEPLSTSFGDPAPRTSAAARKVSLGTVPDFAFKGPGVRITGVTQGSPAEKAGLRAGDVLLELGARKLQGLRDLSEALKSAKAGDKLKLVYQRGADRRTTEVTLASR